MTTIPFILPQTASELGLRIGILMAAIAVDWLFGEPDFLWRRLPHPVVLFGRCIGFVDKKWNYRRGKTGRGRLRSGVMAMLCLGLLAWFVGYALSYGGWAIELVALAILLAGRSLDEHVHNVAAGLSTDINAGRSAVAMIVGRSTDNLDAGDISRAAIETGAENLSDGVIAPAFWFLLFGLPGLLIYKMTNTADSMIGYKNAKYRAFGWAAAMLDDVLNYIPARLTGLLIVVASIGSGGGAIRAVKSMVTEARYHASPNAGWPEAAMAGGLDVWLAGPRAYGNRVRDAARFNKDGSDANADDIVRSLSILQGAQLYLLILLAGVLVILKASYLG